MVNNSTVQDGEALKNVFLGYKKKIDEEIALLITQQRSRLSSQLHWKDEALQKIMPFATAGKSLRGGLVCFAYQLYHDDIPPAVVKAAAAVELFHTGLLIHDDIMDRDEQRRHLKSIHLSFREDAATKGASDADAAHLGESLAICAGDICFFLGYQLISTLFFDKARIPEMIQLCSEELTTVGFAQMDDVSNSSFSTM